jgi:hypothetical protein
VGEDNFTVRIDDKGSREHPGVRGRNESSAVAAKRRLHSSFECVWIEHLVELSSSQPKLVVERFEWVGDDWLRALHFGSEGCGFFDFAHGYEHYVFGGEVSKLCDLLSAEDASEVP